MLCNKCTSFYKILYFPVDDFILFCYIYARKISGDLLEAFRLLGILVKEIKH